MFTTPIIIAYIIWFIGTTIIICVGRFSSKNRGLLYSGGLALLGALAGYFAIHYFFETAFQCQKASCWAEKVSADGLVQFVLLTWGAMGGSIIARAIDVR
ncbi:hypothetical protein [Alcaligenes sp. HNGD-HTN06]|uniref:hypothetical protein n=1 Tax=Alcaligenes sp. HNGD-HTN06 TaxID=3416924 RepID=UPI003CEE30C7